MHTRGSKYIDVLGKSILSIAISLRLQIFSSLRDENLTKKCLPPKIRDYVVYGTRNTFESIYNTNRVSNFDGKFQH